MELDYRKDVSINVAHFDQEWLRQADLALRYGEELAESRRLMDSYEEAMKVEKAKAYLRASELNLKVDATKATADIDPAYLKASQDYTSACHTFNLVKAGYDAIMVKKSTMENYLKGQLAGLWGQPVEPRQEGGESYREKAQETMKNQATEASKEAASKRQRSRTA